MFRDFVRHEALDAAMREGAWSLAGIGHGDLRALRSMSRLLQLPESMTLYADALPALPAFASLEANFQGEPTDCCRIARQTIDGIAYNLRALAVTCSLDITAGLTRNNVTVQAVVVAIDASGTRVFAKMQSRVDEPLPATELAMALSPA